MSTLQLLLSACTILAPTASAIDFVLNQQAPTGQPLVSSFFGVPGANATYDYVVVGGGTGGLALATRLAAANLSVAVVEAGGFYVSRPRHYQPHHAKSLLTLLLS